MLHIVHFQYFIYFTVTTEYTQEHWTVTANERLSEKGEIVSMKRMHWVEQTKLTAH